jgi:hypothetical protein
VPELIAGGEPANKIAVGAVYMAENTLKGLEKPLFANFFCGWSKFF